MEPERKIEKLLRAFARKRRADAPSLDLHPASRRLLQNEVARRGQKPAAEGFSLFGLLRTRLALIGCVALAAIMGASLLLPSRNRIGTTPGALAKKESFNEADAFQPAAPSSASPASSSPATAGTPVVVSLDDADRDGAAARTRSPARAGADAPTLPEASGLAFDVRKESKDQLPASPAEAPAVAHSMPSASASEPVSDTKLATVGGSTLFKADEETRQTWTNLAALKTEAGAVADGSAFNEPVVAQGRMADAVTFDDASDRLAKAQPPARRFIRADVAPLGQTTMGSLVAIPPVLANFQVEQNGAELRIVDADGSIYRGSMEIAAADKEKQMAPVGEPGNIAGAGKSNQELVVTDYSFRVVGTNRTLNQNVIFVGTLVNATNSPAAPGTAGGRPKISGRATIGGQKEIPVNAESTAY